MKRYRTSKLVVDETHFCSKMSFVEFEACNYSIFFLCLTYKKV